MAGVHCPQNSNEAYQLGIKIMKKFLLGTVALIALGVAALHLLRTLPHGHIRQRRLLLR